MMLRELQQDMQRQNSLRDLMVWALADALGMMAIAPALLVLTPKTLADLVAPKAAARNLMLLAGLPLVLKDRPAARA